MFSVVDLATCAWILNVWCARILMSVAGAVGVAEGVASCVSTPPGVTTAPVTPATSSPLTTPAAETSTSAPGTTEAAVTSAQTRVTTINEPSQIRSRCVSAGSFKCECPAGWELRADEKTVRYFLAYNRFYPKIV